MQMQGAWSEALDEARRACSRLAQGSELQAPAAAFYQQGEVHRLRGQFREAEAAYLEASRRGFEPQPGLALLRMNQGRITDAAQALRRITAATQNSLQRSRFLPALVEILLAGNDIAEARTARDELDALACAHDIPVLNAIAAQTRGAVELASGDAGSALNSLRLAQQVWQAGEAPYATARVRELLGMACRELGDAESAKLELQAARSVFRKLGARPDLARIEMQLRRDTSLPQHGLSPRELQVLQLAAAGKTNKSIAAELCLSERTVDRHISNLLGKLDLPSRTAATAFACRHHLV
jgi:DNA-binding CsgD family transcriptional regulator